MSLEFQTPWLLYLIWIIPGLSAWWWLRLRRREQALARFVPPALQRGIVPPENPGRVYWQHALISAGALLLLIGTSGPRWGERDEVVLHTGRELVIAIDVSLSMLADDVRPSRLQRAIVDTMDLINELKGDRAALIAFRYKPRLICPLTTDYTFLRQALNGISPDAAPRGETDIGAAIQRALAMFDEKEASHKAVILLSDGEDLGGLTLEMTELAAERGVPIYTVGIGSPSGSTIPDPQDRGRVLQHEGEPIVTKLDHDALYTIARKTGGSYVPVETAGAGSTTLGTLYRDHLRSISRQEMAKSRQRRLIERYPWFVFPAFLLLCGAGTLSRGHLATSSRRPQGVAALLALGLLLSPGLLPAATTNAQERNVSPSAPATPDSAAPFTADPREMAREAQRLYRQEVYDQAAERYLAAAGESKDATARDTYRYNAAVSLARHGNYAKAAERFMELSRLSKSPISNIHEPLGRARYLQASTPASEAKATEKAHHLKQAADAFRVALRDKPTPERRHDLSLSLRELSTARKQARLETLMETYAQDDAATLADTMLATQREITEAITTAATNALPERIRAFEKLARQQQENADRWMPLGAKLSESLAQQPDAANAIMPLMQAAQDSMEAGRQRLRDLDVEGYREAKMAEQATYQLWKSIVSYEPLLNENHRRQQHAMDQLAGNVPPDPTMTPAEYQRDNAELTALFQHRFEQAIPPEGTLDDTASQDGEGPQGISPEARARIIELARQAAESQHQAAGHIEQDEEEQARDAQEQARRMLEEIQSLIPKPPPQDQQPDDQEQEQEQEQDENQEQDAFSPQKQPPREDDPEPEPEPQDDPESPGEDRDIQAILERALEREKEHEEEKRRREQRIPLPPSSRDW